MIVCHEKIGRNVGGSVGDVGGVGGVGGVGDVGGVGGVVVAAVVGGAFVNISFGRSTTVTHPNDDHRNGHPEFYHKIIYRIIASERQ